MPLSTVHESEDAFIARMQNILRVANNLKELAALYISPFHSTIGTSYPPVTIDWIDLPSPPSLLPPLLEAGLGQEVAAAVSKVYRLRSDELRRHIQESIVTTCHEIAHLPTVASASSPDSLIRSVVSSFTRVYLRRLEQWKEEVIHRIKQRPKTSCNLASKNSRAFNHEYVPLLEHFFEENPFPTHRDKMFLATKSNMEYKQIHVWFQNRRNRTKKEGRTLRKKLTYEGKKSWNKLYEHMTGYMVDTESRALELLEAGGFAVTNQWEETFTSSSPPHAFPSCYPPTCRYDPFPCKNGPVYFGKPEWKRMTDGKRSLPSSISIDDLTERFSRLNVRDGTHSKESNLQSHAATLAITVVPPRAPHPSLVASKYSQPTKIVQFSPSVVRAPSSCWKAFQSPVSKPATLVPLSMPPKKCPPGKRKIAPLPQRFPSQIQDVPRETPPSESSLTPFSSPRLFSMDSGSRSCSPLSDAGNVQEVPNLFGSQCRSPLDSPIRLRGLGNIVAVPLSSVS